MVFRRGQFTINGSSSEEFNVYMTTRPERLSAGRVIEMRKRSGADSIVMDFGYYENVEWKISCYAKVRKIEDVSNQEDIIKAWLDTTNYTDFTYFFDREYIYQAMVIKPPSFTGTRKNGNLIPFEFTISLRPFKESYPGRNWLNETKSFKIHNDKKYPSYPKIHILGSGDISFYINERKYSLKNINQEIVIDSQNQMSYSGEGSTFVFMDDRTLFDDFPYLDVGWNEIKWTGAVTEFNLLPRWCTKV